MGKVAILPRILDTATISPSLITAGYVESFWVNQNSFSDACVLTQRVISARVLVGRTIQGDPSMRVPPAGYDTTGNGGSIFGRSSAGSFSLV